MISPHPSSLCDRVRDAISATIDGEEPGVDRPTVERHLARCAACRSYDHSLSSHQPPRRNLPPGAVPDVSKSVVARAVRTDRQTSWSYVRVLLAVVAVQIIILSIPSLAARDESGASAHDARHLGAFSVAYAVVLLAAVIRPARARTVLPAAVVLAIALSITAALDLLNGNVPLIGEIRHVPEVFSVWLLWMLAARRRPDPSAQRAAHLTVVDNAAGDRTDP